MIEPILKFYKSVDLTLLLNLDPFTIKIFKRFYKSHNFSIFLRLLNFKIVKINNSHKSKNRLQKAIIFLLMVFEISIKKNRKAN